MNSAGIRGRSVPARQRDSPSPSAADFSDGRGDCDFIAARVPSSSLRLGRRFRRRRGTRTDDALEIVKKDAPDMQQEEGRKQWWGFGLLHPCRYCILCFSNWIDIETPSIELYKVNT